MQYIKRVLRKLFTNLITKPFAPYKVVFKEFTNDGSNKSETHLSWSYSDALEWTACALRNDEVVYIHNRYNKFINKDRLIAWRYSV